MQLPKETAHYSIRVRYGRYVARRLKSAGLGTISEDCLKTTHALRVEGRASEDADDAIQDALADRDAADDDLDIAAQNARLAIASRGLSAVTEEPYTSIFDRGIGYYTAAPLDEEEARYNEFVTRLDAHLPASDATRKETVKAIKAGLVDFKRGVTALQAARSAASIQSTKLLHVTEKWERQMERCYGLLVADLGKARAEKFFPRASSSRSAEPVAAPADAPLATPATK